MDTDLVNEVERLRRIFEEQGLQMFHTYCLADWQTSNGQTPRSPLFRFATPDGTEKRREDGKECGCLTQIKNDEPYLETLRVAWTDEWTEAIRCDARIPKTMGELRPEHLSAFAEWQQAFRDYFRQSNQQCVYPEKGSRPITAAHSIQ